MNQKVFVQTLIQNLDSENLLVNIQAKEDTYLFSIIKNSAIYSLYFACNSDIIFHIIKFYNEYITNEN